MSVRHAAAVRRFDIGHFAKAGIWRVVPVCPEIGTKISSEGLCPSDQDVSVDNLPRNSSLLTPRGPHTNFVVAVPNVHVLERANSLHGTNGMYERYLLTACMPRSFCFAFSLSEYRSKIVCHKMNCVYSCSFTIYRNSKRVGPMKLDSMNLNLL